MYVYSGIQLWLDLDLFSVLYLFYTHTIARRRKLVFKLFVELNLQYNFYVVFLLDLHFANYIYVKSFLSICK